MARAAVISATAVAERLDVDRSTILRWAKQEPRLGVQVGESEKGAYIFTESEVTQLKRRRGKPGRPKGS